MSSASPGRMLHAVDHYENFPVASWLVPARLRPAIVAIYRYARYADDLVDEGDAEPCERIEAIEALREAIRGGHEDHPIAGPVLAACAEHRLPTRPLLALLDAFEQDVTVARYADDVELNDYCSRSANPVGELVLRLFGRWTPETAPRSDAICTALQQINFLQDIGADWSRGRVYLPERALAAEGLAAADVGRAVARGESPPALARVVAARARHARGLLGYGTALLSAVPIRLSLELRATLAGGHRILDRLAASGFDPIARRPRLDWRDAPALLRRAASLPRDVGAAGSPAASTMEPRR